MPNRFVGRASELAEPEDRLLDTDGEPRIAVIGGPGGIGKTWLTVHWAREHAARFPDGQLFVDLRGFSPDSAPMPPDVALRGFLRALGVPSSHIPADPHARAALFHSLTADRQVLVILDNAGDCCAASSTCRWSAGHPLDGTRCTTCSASSSCTTKPLPCTGNSTTPTSLP